MKQIKVALLVTGILATLGRGSWADPQSELEQANQYLDDHKWDQAYAAYHGLQPKSPDDIALLGNFSMAALRSFHPQEAITALHHLESLGDKNWRTQEKLIEAYQMLGQPQERDREQALLQLAWQGGQEPDLLEQTGYIRDFFKVGTKTVFCVQFFQPHSPTFYLYDFTSRREGQSELEPGKIGLVQHTVANPGPANFTLESYVPPATHTTHSTYPTSPSYESIKAEVIKGYFEKQIPPAER